MLERLEGAKHYLLNLAQRTVGLEATKASWAELKPSPEDPNLKATKRRALLYSANSLYVQVVSPLMYRELSNEDKQRKIAWSLDQPYEYSRRNLIQCCVGLGVDACLTVTAWRLTQNLAEAVAIKMVVNAVSNAGTDLAGAVANKIRHHRPAGTTLAV